MKTVIRPETEMKDSGIDTVEKMPLSWNKIRLKNLVKIRTGNEDTKNATPNGKYRFYVRSPIVERCDRYTFEGEAILVAGDGAGAGRIFHLVDGRYAVHQRVYCLSDFKYNAKFIHYYLENLFPFEMDKGSAQSTVPSMRLPMLLNFKIVLPGENECLKIIDYLDETCSKIDEIIAEAKASIDEYKELKQSVIFEAVTKGLDKNVEFIDSGDEWLGKYPQSYNIGQLSMLSNIVRGGSPRPAGDPRYYGGNISFMRIADITKDDNIYVNSCENTITEEGLTRTRMIPPNTLLLTNSGATLGVPKINTFETAFNDGIAAFLDLDERLNIVYVYFFLKARTSYFLECASMGMGQPNLNTDIIGRTKIVFPTLVEQQKVISYLEDRCGKLNSLISEKESLIKDLESYKKSLIYEVVTGKRRVV